MANIEDALHLVEQLGLVIEFGIFPIKWMTRGWLQAAFSLGHDKGN